jgi:hypothetical protein
MTFPLKETGRDTAELTWPHGMHYLRAALEHSILEA